MNRLQNKLNKLVRFSFSCYSNHDLSMLSYNHVRNIWREELKNKYNKEQVIKMTIEELWDNFGED